MAAYSGIELGRRSTVQLHVALLLLGLSMTPDAPPATQPIDLSIAPPPNAGHPIARVVFAPAGEGIILPASQEQKPPDKAEEKKPPTPPHTGVRALLSGLVEDVKHLPSKDNAYVALAGGAGALAVHPFDDTFNVHLRSHYDLANTIYTPGKWVGQTPVQMGAALAVYVLGRRNDQAKVSHFGMDLLRAQIIDEALTDLLKLATRRERPDHSDKLSFPSGHSSMTFTTATVIERHLGWKYSIAGYAIASYVASSRLHDNRHWLSDVVFGAAVGTISGRTVTQHGRDVWTFAPVAVPGGVAVVAVRR